jgi:hypothetical protein
MAHVLDQVNLLPTTSRMNRNVKTFRSIVSQCSCQLGLSVHPGLTVQTPLVLEKPLLFHGTDVAMFLTLTSLMLTSLTNTTVNETLDILIGSRPRTYAVFRLVAIGIVVPEIRIDLPAVHVGRHGSQHANKSGILTENELIVRIVPAVTAGDEDYFPLDGNTITKGNNTSPDSHGVLLGDEIREPVRGRQRWNYARRHRLLTLNLGKMGERLSTAVAEE